MSKGYKVLIWVVFMVVVSFITGYGIDYCATILESYKNMPVSAFIIIIFDIVIMVAGLIIGGVFVGYNIVLILSDGDLEQYKKGE